MEALWNATRSQVAFCVGDSREGATALLGQSFPWPPVSGPPGDPICADGKALEPFLCGPPEIELYIRVSDLQLVGEGDRQCSGCCPAGWVGRPVPPQTSPFSLPARLVGRGAVG